MNATTDILLSSAVFTWTNLLVVVAELDGGENEALDLVPLVTNVVLEVGFGTVVFIDCCGLVHQLTDIFAGTSADSGDCGDSRPWHCTN